VYEKFIDVRGWVGGMGGVTGDADFTVFLSSLLFHSMRSIERAPSIAWYRMKKYKAKVM